MFFAEAFVSFAAFYLVLSHLAPKHMRRVAGYKMQADIILHVSVIGLFLGTSTEGLMQAEAAAIMFSLYLRAYRYFAGYERLTKSGWQRYAGKWTNKRTLSWPSA